MRASNVYIQSIRAGGYLMNFSHFVHLLSPVSDLLSMSIIYPVNLTPFECLSAKLIDQFLPRLRPHIRPPHKVVPEVIIPQ